MGSLLVDDTSRSIRLRTFRQSLFNGGTCANDQNSCMHQSSCLRPVLVDLSSATLCMPDEHRLGRSKNTTQFHSSESSNLNGLGCLLFTPTPDDQRCFNAFSSLFRNTDDHLHVESVVLVIVHVVRELKSVHSMLVMVDLLGIERCSNVRWASWWEYWADRMDQRLSRSMDDTRSACWTDRKNVRNCNRCCWHYQAERNVREIFHLDTHGLKGIFGQGFVLTYVSCIGIGFRRTW